MNSNKKTATILEDVKITVKIKLSAIWVTIMFVYIYVDIFRFYKPGGYRGYSSGKSMGT